MTPNPDLDAGGQQQEPDRINTTETTPFVETPPPKLPERIGRYRVERLLGKGGFGLVYLAHDEQLNRPIAVKVPHARLVSRPEDAERYLTEARTVANLDHPNIVPVHDVGSTEGCPCYVVSKYIDGTDLATRLKQSHLSLHEAVELVLTVAEALHHAHKQGLVHRDIKPGNILLDKSGKPFVADFGLALREQEVGKGPRYAGTPAYMSPEQARGEGHRVDGRSDIFSLGVVFYELLVGRQPFRAESQAELLEQVTNHEARPLRQVDEGIPKELERVCFKALAKRASERYMTAKDFADDLRHFLAEQTVNQQSGHVGKGSGSPVVMPVMQLPSTSKTPTSDYQPIKIVPKGLRSFDAHDADFFLELLPGPWDRDGLPDSIRFWKIRIEETDAEKTFSVGLICGPSGCGKSSLVKAGLLPHLSDAMIAVYVEATGEETETRLLNGLRKRCPALPDNLSLKATLAALRLGQGIPVGKKVLILLDQFEQWLHAKREETNTELVQSLRQCDGGRLQCIVMVRDDFWMAVIRFMRELEIRLLEGQNSAAVDLFDRDHARKVLAAFGRAFGKLPESSGETSKEQKEFLKQAVSGLAQEGKIICVRLALFAEMMKGKAWTPATLKEVGGTAGVGATFLEETFSAGTAPPEHRYHQKAARVVLKALLPESVTDIRGHMRSYADLLKLSGYESRPKDFDDLIRLLDNEIRLITPTDPEGKEDDSASSMKAGEKYYQLTHDYLVHSLRDWLTRKQKETRRGRAELRLAERSALWNAKPENRHLPAWWEFLHVRLLVGKKNWTDPQRRMMWKAGRYHAFRGCLLAAILIMIGWGSYEGYGHLRAAALRERLLDASTTEVPQIVQEIKPLRRWADSRLREAFSEAEAKGDFRRQLHASLALLPWDAGQRDYLYERLLNAEPQEVPAIRDALAPHKEVLTDTLWAVVEQPAQGKERQRLRAACALAAFDPDSQRWEEVKGKVADDLVREPAVYLATWIECLRPVTANLLEPLGAIFRDTNRRETERSLATDILADYAADQASMLADLVLDADEKQFAVLFPKLKGHGEDGARPLLTEIHKLSVAENDKENLAKRQANAAVALLRMDRPEEVWPLLKHRPDPRVRSYLIHRLAPMGADPRAILKRLEEEPDLTIRRALLLTLGEFGERAFEGGERELLMEKLRYLYRNDRDPGLHAAAEWLLRTWKQQQWLKQAEQEWAKNKQQREQRCQSVRQELAQKKGEVKPQWYVTGEGQTMVVIPGPVEFLMGSPTSEPGRSDNETLHLKRIGHTFAIAAKAVTLDQYLRFRRDYDYKRQYAPVGDCPVHGTPWYQAAEYCNWLSDQAGLPEHEWCYERNKGGRYEAGMKPAANYLQRTGYRLPTEAEWEYACRAGAVTSRYYGQSEELLGKYDWYLKNSGDRTWPVGSLKPNDFGLFDMHGNVWAWCHDSYRLYEAGQRGKAAEDSEDNSLVPDATSRVLRGGGFLDQPRYLRSAYRNWDLPGTRSNALGFRPARTYN